MDTIAAIDARHSVRSYESRYIDARVVEQLKADIEATNASSGLHVSLVTRDEHAFKGFLARRGGFQGATNYLVMAGPRDMADLEERVGYFGERLVLIAQQLGLNSCWVGSTFNHRATKRAAKLASGDRLVCLIALGYGTTQGVVHRTKSIKDACEIKGVDIATGASMSPGGATSPIKGVDDLPIWFRNGVMSALKAPSALNLQNFLFTYDPDSELVGMKSLGGPFSKVNLGIAAYHFEVASGHAPGLF